MNNASKQENSTKETSQSNVPVSTEAHSEKLPNLEENEEVLVRPGKVSEEHRELLNQKLASLRTTLLTAIQTHGAGQALAWLDSQSKLEEVALLQIKLCALLEINSEEHELLPEYSKCTSIQAVAFRQRLLDTLYSMTIDTKN